MLILIGIRIATKWYADHLKSTGIDVIMLSDDRANRDKAAAMQVRTYSGMDCVYVVTTYRVLTRLLVRNYVEGVKDTPELLDMLSASNKDDNKHEEIVYEEVNFAYSPAFSYLHAKIY